MSSIQKVPGCTTFSSSRSHILGGIVVVHSNRRHALIVSFDLMTTAGPRSIADTPLAVNTNSLPAFLAQKLILYVSPGLVSGNSLKNPGDSLPPVESHLRTTNFN